MPSRLSMRRLRQFANVPFYLELDAPRGACFFCSLSSIRPAASSSRQKRKTTIPRYTSTLAAEIAPDARQDLIDTLESLKKYSTVITGANVDAINLAIQSLRQEPGREWVRVAIRGVKEDATKKRSGTAAEIARLLLADPLREVAPWEEELSGSDGQSKKFVLRVQAIRDESPRFELQPLDGSRAFSVESPSLGSHDLEVVVDEVLFGEPTKPTDAHESLLVGDGLYGAVELASAMRSGQSSQTTAALNLSRKFTPPDASSLPVTFFDLEQATAALALFRSELKQAIEYEKLWYESNIPSVLDRIKAGAAPTHDGSTKLSVRRFLEGLVASLKDLASELDSISVLAGGTPPSAVGRIAILRQALAQWAEDAHAELQTELEAAFHSRKWRKMNWWKLFWRVDDVAVLSSGILTKHFLPDAERSIIFLAGRLRAAELVSTIATNVLEAPGPRPWPQFLLPTSPAPVSSTANVLLVAESGSGEENNTTTPTTDWPTRTSFTRTYLQTEAVPALQALAQRLTIQTMGTSGLSTALAALMYLSSFSLYEAGAVASLGVVLSLRRLQSRWETARDYWQAEVREEGRKAVRAVELEVAAKLEEAEASSDERGVVKDELEQVKQLIESAEEAFARLK